MDSRVEFIFGREVILFGKTLCLLWMSVRKIPPLFCSLLPYPILSHGSEGFEVKQKLTSQPHKEERILNFQK